MNFPLHAFAVGLALLAGLSTAPTHAEEARDAEAIMKRVLARGTFGWDGARTDVRMILEDGSGKSEQRRMRILGQRRGNRLETLVRFTSPAEVKGMAFLMRRTAEGRSEQHVFLPRLGRTRRISGREREGSFMGSDFSYADLEQRYLAGATHRRLDDDELGSHPMHVIKSIPARGSDAPYSKIQTWIRKSDLVPLRTRFYDPEGRLLKTLYVRRVKKLAGHPVVMRARMHNHQTSHVTILVVDSVERRKRFPEGTFTPTALERG
ncbi:MAG: outer membrane lipoprotein-sorting protein [Myxococcota bacterium]